ncbi:unnamed protein product [Cunninghamella blakesleeana]
MHKYICICLMKKNMIQFILFILFSVILEYIAKREPLSFIRAVGPHLLKTCQCSPIVFTNNAGIDEILCIIKAFYRLVLDDDMGIQLLRVTSGFFGTIQVIMAIEESRYGNNEWYNSVSWCMFWGMAANFLTMSITSSIWLSIFAISSFSFISITRHGKDDPQHDDSIPVMCSRQRVAAIFLSATLSYGLISLLMTTPILDKSSTWLSDQIILLWLFAPIIFHLLYILLTTLFNHIPFFYNYFNDTKVQLVSLLQFNNSNDNTEASKNDDNNVDGVNQVRQRERMVQSKNAVENGYNLLFFINLFILIGTHYEFWSKNLHIMEESLNCIMNPIPTANLNEIQTNQYFCSCFLLKNLSFTFIIYSVWALYEDGFIIFVAILVGAKFAGPGASIAAYASYRERRIQNPENLKIRIKKENQINHDNDNDKIINNICK